MINVKSFVKYKKYKSNIERSPYTIIENYNYYCPLYSLELGNKILVFNECSDKLKFLNF